MVERIGQIFLKRRPQMTIQTSKTKALSISGHAGKTMATFTALALLAMSAGLTPAHAAPGARVDVRVNLGGHGYHEDQMVRQDPIFRRIGMTRARIDHLLDRRAISRFEARRLNEKLDEIAFDARLALQGRRTDRRLLVSAEMRLDDVTDRLDDTRFRRVTWYR
jgi:hypothetical protein